MYSLGIIFAFILSVHCYPYCNNWCQQPYNYGGLCCDHTGGYSGSSYGYIPNPNYPNNIESSSKVFCPKANCTSSVVIGSSRCSNDDDCKRKELCCENPCVNGVKMCLEHVKLNSIAQGCKSVSNCDVWVNENPNPMVCNDDNDCKRTDTCCYNPCKGKNVCQKTESSTELTNSHVACPNPGNCY